MDRHQISLVRASFTAVMAVADDFSAAFYSHLFDLDPSLRAMFADDLTGQRQKLVDELEHIVGALDRLPPFMERATQLGRRHVEYGVLPHHYDLVLDATLHALRIVLGDGLTDDDEVAWRRAYNLAAAVMLQGAGATAPAVIDYD